MDPNNSSMILCPLDKKMTNEEYQEMMRESMKRQWIVMLMVVAMVLLSTAIVVVCEHFNRKWESQRSRKVTRIPKTPINEKRLILYNGSRFSENKTPEAKILISGPVSSKNKGSAKLNKILKMIFGLEDCKENIVPTNTKIISIKMEGFKHGANCHDFEPIDGSVPGSFFTYQIYGQSIIQVTRYVVEKRSYVAGFCIYNEFTECSGNDERKVHGVDININVIKKLMASPKYPGREALKSKVKVAYEQPRATTQRLPNCRNVRYCRELKRGMMTDDESDAVYHQDWDPTSKSMKTWKCNGCTGNVDDGVPPSYSSLSMV